MNKENLEKYREHLGSWTEVLQDAIKAFEDSARPAIKASLDAGKTVYPSPDNIFRAFRECELDDLKVVIIGQDPYHDGSATGLCFDNKYPSKISPSLRNILNEMAAEDLDLDIDAMQKSGSYLGHLPKQGVLLINTALTVEKSSPATHAKYWRDFTDAVIKYINDNKDGIIWVLWGAHALSIKDKIDNESHYFIVSSHPSPLSYTKTLRTYPKFKGSKPFSKVNDILSKLNSQTINW